MIRIAAATLGLLVSLSGAAAAPDAVVDETVKEFVRLCLATLPDTKKIRAYANIEKWESLPPEAAALIAPADPTADWKGWFIRPKKQFVAVSNGKSPDGNPMSGCVLVSFSGNHRDAIPALMKFQPDLKLVDERTEAGQHTVMYTGSIMAYPPRRG